MDIIVDIDGTIASGEHRQSYYDAKPRDYKTWSSLMHLDAPHYDIIELVSCLWRGGHRIIMATGRNEIDRETTVKWLKENNIIPISEMDNHFPRLDYKFAYQKLYMRNDRDHRQDNIAKIEMLDWMRSDGFKPVMAIDDRTRVVNAWREAGLRCIQVRNGDF